MPIRKLCKKKYDIEIEKVYINNNQNNKSMLIKITDKELLEKTGGIIQRDERSLIIQEGKFVGAVTNVLVNDPTQGYGVFCRHNDKRDEVFKIKFTYQKVGEFST